jgi:hypothetical protein
MIPSMLYELDRLEERLSHTTYLSKTLDRAWLQRVRGVIERMGPELIYTDQAYHLFRILRDEPGLVEQLDTAVGQVNGAAANAKRLRPYKETLQKLKSPEANQIQAAIFEFLVLGELIAWTKKEELEIEVYPRTGSGSRNIEARILIDIRWCNIEAKALGYSGHDVGMKEGRSRVGSHSVESMSHQIYAALEDKLNQLCGTPRGEANIVLMALGLNADKYSAPVAVENFFKNPEWSQHLSAVLLYGSFLCCNRLKLLCNCSNRCGERRLTETEKRFLERFFGAKSE